MAVATRRLVAGPSPRAESHWRMSFLRSSCLGNPDRSSGRQLPETTSMSHSNLHCRAPLLALALHCPSTVFAADPPALDQPVTLSLEAQPLGEALATVALQSIMVSMIAIRFI